MSERSPVACDTKMEWINESVLPGEDVGLDRAQGSIFFAGNATTILSYAGFTILTDPNFLHRGDHVHLGHGMTAGRRTDPALELEAIKLAFVPLDMRMSDPQAADTQRARHRNLRAVR